MEREKKKATQMIEGRCITMEREREKDACVDSGKIILQRKQVIFLIDFRSFVSFDY